MTNFRTFATALALIGLMAGSALADDTSRIVPFTLGGADFKLPLPESYCVATGSYADTAEQAAKADPMNVTLVSFVDCAEQTAGTPQSRWGILKALKQTANGGAGPRQAILAYFKTQIDPAALQQINSFAADQGSKALQDATGTALKLKVDFKPLDTDTVAAYMGGTLNVTTPTGETMTGAGAFGITVVNDRVFYLYMFTTKSEPRDILEQLAKAKAATQAFVAANGG